MLSEIQKEKFDENAKKEIQRLLKILRIDRLNEYNIADLQSELDLEVSSLVSKQEDGEATDSSLLEIYDLLVDIVLENEDNLEFLNSIFYN